MKKNGEKLKKRRLELNLTLEEVGNIVGVAKSTVRKWETGAIENMKSDKISLLAKALQVSPAFIMGLENTEPHISKEQQLINTISNYLNENSQVTLSEIKRGNKVDIINSDKNIIATYDVELIIKAYEEKYIKQQFSLKDIEEIVSKYRIPDELKGVTRKQYIKFIGESAMFFDDKSISDETKSQILLSLQEVFYDAKERNKRKK
ncbi:helix-turn-helix domain-containing protein [uncultured Fusobacterium sp.]|uniref:helix-turn-helix domain-containing protein n=1 Tax=uncultured Fusobacterium sp. TaxID=159267 RepID=UPI0025921404|nr:helix-turn-helix domain-containing protein [uncultured Fusobacterium sp.]